MLCLNGFFFQGDGSNSLAKHQALFVTTKFMCSCRGFQELLQVTIICHMSGWSTIENPQVVNNLCQLKSSCTRLLADRGFLQEANVNYKLNSTTTLLADLGFLQEVKLTHKLSSSTTLLIGSCFLQEILLHPFFSSSIFL